MQTVVIRLFEGTEEVEWLCLDAHGRPEGKPQRSLLDDIPAQQPQDHVVVVVPSIDMLITHVQAPANMPASRLAKAAPLILEAQLSEPIESLHFAVSPSQEAGCCDVVVVSHEQIQQWLSRLQAHQITAHKMLPDVLMLPLNDNHWTLLIEAEHGLVRTSPESGFAIDRESVISLLELKLHEHGKPVAFDLYAAPDIDVNLVKQRLEALSCKLHSCNEVDSLLPEVISQLDKHSALNILQGNYAVTPKREKVRKRSMLAASVGLFAVVIFFASTFGQWFYLQYQKQQIDREVFALYQTIFPRATKVVSPQTRIEQELKNLQFQASGNPFLNLVPRVAEVLRRDAAVKIQTVNYREEKMRIVLEVDTFQNLQTVVQNLRAKALSVTQENAVSKGEKVSAQLIISEAKS